MLVASTRISLTEYRIQSVSSTVQVSPVPVPVALFSTTVLVIAACHDSNVDFLYLRYCLQVPGTSTGLSFTANILRHSKFWIVPEKHSVDFRYIRYGSATGDTRL